MTSLSQPTGVYSLNNQWRYCCPKCDATGACGDKDNSRTTARALYKAHRADCTGVAPKATPKKTAAKKIDHTKPGKPAPVPDPVVAAKPEATVEKTDKPKAKKTGGVCAQVWSISDEVMKNKRATPQEVYAACEKAGIHSSTTRVQFSKWCRAKFGKSPREQFAKEAAA